MPEAAGAEVRGAVAGALAREPRGAVLLAVSGGCDSMSLLDAASAVAPDRIAGVATFDHGTGAHARAAAELVVAEAGARGVPVLAGAAALAGAGEAAWRAARWAFLRAAAARLGASVVATAHTADDQVETVALRLLRGAGARGLAALAADAGDVRRPLLGVRRAAVRAYAAARALRWLEDPSNAVPDVQRNRLRLELLPALAGGDPGLADALAALGGRAAAWRREAEALAARLADARAADGAPAVPVAALAPFDAAGLAVIWPPLVAAVGVPLERRGLARLVAFTRRTCAAPRGGARIPLAGGAGVVVERVRPAGGAGRTVPGFVVRRAGA